MNKIGYVFGAAGLCMMGLMTYTLMNKQTKKEADKVINDVLSKTDQIINGK